VTCAPFHFDRPDLLADSLRGVATLYNTYWIRFEHGDRTFERAVSNTKTLFAAARRAGVRRIVHVSITNPALSSPLPYFRGKAELERTLREEMPSYAILRPAVIYGREDILINNIAWLLRKLPIFGLPGRGDYQLQPILVDDLADLAVDAGHAQDNRELDAIGPDTFTFKALVELIRTKVQSPARLVPMPPRIAWLASRLFGAVVGDVILTRDEVRGLMQNLLVTDSPPAGRTHLADWLDQHADEVGRQYASELARHYR
jgi:NADH dehydrogenase